SYPLDEENLRLRSAVCTALGPLTTLLLAWFGTSLADASLLPTPAGPVAPTPLLYLLLTGLGYLALVSSIANLIPRRESKVSKVANDGMRLWRLRVGGPMMERQLLFRVALGYTWREVPARDRPPTLVPRLVALARGTCDEYLASVIAYS